MSSPQMQNAQKHGFLKIMRAHYWLAATVYPVRAWLGAHSHWLAFPTRRAVAIFTLIQVLGVGVAACMPNASISTKLLLIAGMMAVHTVAIVAMVLRDQFGPFNQTP